MSRDITADLASATDEQLWLGGDPLAEPASEALLSITVGPHVHVRVDSAYQITVSVHGGSAVIDAELMADALSTAQGWAAAHRPVLKGTK